MSQEYQLSLLFNGPPSDASIRMIDARAGVTIDRIYSASSTHFMTVTVAGKARLEALKAFIGRTLKKQCTPISEMKCTDPATVPPPIQRRVPV